MILKHTLKIFLLFFSGFVIGINIIPTFVLTNNEKQVIMTTLKLNNEIKIYKSNSNVFTLTDLMKKVGNAKLCNKAKLIWNEFIETI
jgi:multidrug efflux pump subunit AcrB